MSDISLEQLEPLWKDLESRAEHRFFLSWSWIAAWLTSFKPQAHLIQVYFGSNIVGMAFICFNKATRHKVLRIKQCILHETGTPKYDQQWIEYNGLLLDKHHKKNARSALLNAIKENFDWDELLLGVASESEIEQFQEIMQLKIHYRWKTCSHGVNLQTLRENEQNYLSSLSRNTRSQIKRSSKRYSSVGEISIQHAESLEQAKSFIKELAPLHIKRWGSGVQQSGFANLSFCDFHLNLVELGWSQNEIDVIKVSAGDQVFAYFYNFLYQNRVYFYLSALEYGESNSFKPGLVGHALCIQEYLDNGYEYYDFMGGGESYKDSLASRVEQLFRVSFQKSKVKLNAEMLARSVKQKILNK